MTYEVDDVNLRLIMSKIFYVSITGLRVKSVWRLPAFWWHASAAMQQAMNAQGCLGAEARLIGGVHHTRSVWTDRQSMKDYLQSGAHLKAIKAFRDIATGKTLGFDAESIPDWDEVHRLWHQKARVY